MKKKVNNKSIIEGFYEPNPWANGKNKDGTKKSKVSQFGRWANTEDNHQIIKDLNALAKANNSHYRLSVKYRIPKPGFHARPGGNLRREEAQAIGIYIKSPSLDEMRHKRNRDRYRENRLLESDVEKQSQVIETLEKEIYDRDNRSNDLAPIIDKHITILELQRKLKVAGYTLNLSISNDRKE